MAGPFTGKVAVVTGGASGIGAASARRLAADGAHVVVADLAEGAAAELAAQLGGTATTLDVADPTAWDDLVDRLTADHGGVDLAHLNAGIVTTNEPGVAFLDVPVARYRTVMGVNLDGVALGIRALAPSMIRRGGGAIVATASIAGLGPWHDDPIYSATKHGVVGLVRSVAPQLERVGVHIHAICPGPVDTPLVAALHPERVEAVHGAMVSADDVADAVARLLAADATGTIETILAGRGAQPYDFRGVPGPRAGDRRA
jgi:NAD(P)-dependent dehydrogenase (short-subunit alcohol dehydrogenase family)